MCSDVEHRKNSLPKNILISRTQTVESSVSHLNPVITLISALAPYERYPPLLSKGRQRFELKS